MTAVELKLMAAILACLGFLTFALFWGALYRCFAWRKQTHSSETKSGEIRELLVDYLSGSNNTDRIQSLAATHRQVLSDTILGFQGAVGGGALDRLCELAAELGLVHDWILDTHSRDPIRRNRAYERLAFVSQNETCRRKVGDVFLLALTDANPEMQISAARGAALSDVVEDVEQVFDFVISQSPLVRILLADVLRRRALLLCEAVVPDALASADTNQVLAALDILVAWESAVPIGNIRGLFERPDKRVRIAVLKLARMLPDVAGMRSAVVAGLADADAEVSMVAALTAGRLRILEALPTLARLLRLAPADIARSAAAALAEMRPRGWQTLEELSDNASPLTAALAREALDRARRLSA